MENTMSVAGSINVEEISSSANNKKFEAEYEKIKKEHDIAPKIDKDIESFKKVLTDRGYFNTDGSLNENRVFSRGNVRDLKNFSTKNPELIIEVADNGIRRLYKRKYNYDDPGASCVYKEKIEIAEDGRQFKEKIELAEDDRVMGIPYAQAMAGDRVYIINGKVFTGWALYFSLSSIKSPEDYARNVDLTYNVPYLYAAILLKAQLGLGTGFDVNYGSTDEEIPEEKLIREYLFEKLRIDIPKLVKTGFHLGVYGNSYWALRRDNKYLVDKITILQPERLKIFLDPMTTKILFYIYLPPIIGGTTIASYPSDGRFNPNVLTGVTLSYPTPIVIHPEDIMHFKINDFTEYPFGFSDVKFCIDPATARLDINILAPIIFKKYTKPMIHWSFNTEGVGAEQIKTKQEEMVTILEDMEPGSDPVTTDRWKANILNVSQGKNDIFSLSADMDTQIFAATGAPETYFKPKGSTDRMISEQDKTFLARLKIPQMIVAEKIEDYLINPRIDYEIANRKRMQELVNEIDHVEEILIDSASYMASTPKYPKVVWKDTFKQDETQAIANAIALRNSGIIDAGRAAVKVGEVPIAKQHAEDMFRTGIDDPITNNIPKPTEILDKIQSLLTQYKIPQDTKEQPQIQGQSPKDQEGTIENLRGGLNVAGKKSESNRNVNDIKDPTKMGGSRNEERKLRPELQ